MALIRCADSTSAAKMVASTLKNCIEEVKRVSFKAMCLSGIYRRRPLTAKDVHLQRDWFKMIRAHTMANTAEVVQSHAIRDRTDKHLIGETMRSNFSATPITEQSIAPLIPLGRPHPASISLIDFCPKPYGSASVSEVPNDVWAAILAPPCIMCSAPATAMLGLIAVWDGTLRSHRKARPFGVTPPEVQASRRLTSLGAL